jgi:hypothetical protein
VDPGVVPATTLKEIDRFTDGAEPSDDLTILTLRLGEAASVDPGRPGGD